MKDANFIDQKGKPQPYYMGCYGIGLARTLAAVVEVHHDDNGIIWPLSVAPYQVHLINLDGVRADTLEVYERLIGEGIEVLWDDREDVSAGEKFADADLIGIPYRVVVSKKTKDKLEVKKRSEKETRFLSWEKLLEVLKS